MTGTPSCATLLNIPQLHFLAQRSQPESIDAFIYGVNSAPKHPPQSPRPASWVPATRRHRIFWHYTRRANMMSILGSLMLYPSLREHNMRDARYGDGQYVSDIEPHTMPSAQLSYWLVGGPYAWWRFTHYVGIDVAGLEVIQGRERVFVIPSREALDLTGRVVSWGANDDLAPPGGVAPRLSRGTG
ncbi:HYD1 signature containing ADP-ribosyltransferase family protein [Spongiactinospora sp. 9N601]|uniref:HYD1 signature containing ADP-ribosyltransferase family protein n=1 Tax=Spongiactinospora sp. 9N601 TaxID=3375149 RepID=UPI0037AF4321